jgi:type I restriction enzyme S subunit
MNWQSVPIKDVAFFQEGPGLRNWQWTDEGIKVVNGRNILTDGQIDLANTDKYISWQEFESTYKHFEVCTDDILVTSSGTLGKVARVRIGHLPLVMNTSVIRFHTLDRNVLCNTFLYCFLRSQQFQEQILAYAIGAAQSNFGPSHLKLMTIPLPPLATQLRISDILTAYDELIENSQQRIKILESMARALYREWFVHFRYPGHESVPLVPSALGDIPQGWEAKELSQIAENFDRFRKPLSKMQRAKLQGVYPYFGAAKVFDYVNDFIFDGEYLLMAEDGSVITTERNPVLQLVNEKFWPNNHTHVLRGKSPVSTHFLYLGLSEVNISPYITGAAQPKITQENMNRIPFVCGPWVIHENFDQYVEPLIRESQLLQRQIQNLRATRDALLPRLLSGQIEVEAIAS